MYMGTVRSACVLLMQIVGLTICSAKTINVTAFPVAYFSNDASEIVYAQFEMRAGKHSQVIPTLLGRLDFGCLVALEGCDTPPDLLTPREETISIHRINRLSGVDVTLFSVSHPPWIGQKYWVGGAFSYQEIRLLPPREGGEPRFEIHGPRPSQENRRFCSNTEVWAYSKKDPIWRVRKLSYNRWSDIPRYSPDEEAALMTKGPLKLEIFDENMYVGLGGPHAICIWDKNAKQVQIVKYATDEDRRYVRSMYKRAERTPAATKAE
jgi:hypothetical protein